MMREPDFRVGAYLKRWYLIPRNRFLNVYFHRFEESDGQDVHDHPWWNVSIVLRGRYREHYHDGTSKIRRPGSIVVRHPLVLHRLEILTPRVNTLFLTGPRLRVWGFLTRAGWVQFDQYPGVNRD
jgi:hypothetical protein